MRVRQKVGWEQLGVVVLLTVVGIYSAVRYEPDLLYIVLLTAALALCIADLIRRYRSAVLEIGPDGLRLKSRMIPWTQVDALVIDTGRLLLVPPPGAALGTLDTVSPVDGRPALTLLYLSRVAGSGAGLAASLRAHGGDRLVETPATADFLIVLRGYHVGEVTALLRRITDARESGDPARRAAAAREARDATLTVVLRGYDRGAVDARLRDAAAELSA